MNWLLFSVAAVPSYPQRFLLWTSGDLHKIPFFIRHGFYYSRKTSYIIIRNKKKRRQQQTVCEHRFSPLHPQRTEKKSTRTRAHTQRAAQLHKKKYSANANLNLLPAWQLYKMPKNIHNSLVCSLRSCFFRSRFFAVIIICIHLNCLRFSVPPDRISIKDESGAERTSVVGPYSEGDTINLYCEVFGGKYRTLCLYFRLVSVEPKCSKGHWRVAHRDIRLASVAPSDSDITWIFAIPKPHRETEDILIGIRFCSKPLSIDWRQKSGCFTLLKLPLEIKSYHFDESLVFIACFT